MTKKPPDEKSKPDKKGYQFRTFQGVFTPSILTILGVVMYLRLGWVLGNLGLWPTLLVITIATSITFLTALSISELATNMRVGGGGAYYIISRSLGLEAGAAIGLPLFFAQALGISFYIAGFSESVANLFPEISSLTVGLTTLALLTVLAYLSADLALKCQFLILILIIASLTSFFMGGAPTMVPNMELNTLPIPKASFWVVFAVFFPAVTGIEAGLSMSGDLKDTERSLPRGTLSAILISYFVYLLIPILLTWHGVGEIQLIKNSMIMRDVARWGNLVIAGLWGAALSSALGALLGAPRTLQALAKDGVIPAWIGRGYGKKSDPRMATAFSFGIALLGILLGDLNMIAPILSMFFLTSYGLLNLSAAFEGIIDNPSWRPKFRVSWIFPLIGAIGCLVVMFMISPGATFMATIVSGGVYYVMQHRRISAYWGDMRYGILMLIIRIAVYKLLRIKPHEKTWRPNILVLSGAPTKRWYLIALADAISQGKGFLTVGAIVPKSVSDAERINNLQTSISTYLKDRHVPAIVKVLNTDNIFRGGRALIQNYGFGPLAPNTIMLGEAEDEKNFQEYCSLILRAVENQRNLIIVREKEEQAHTFKYSTRIDLWWRRIGNNSGLMLALAYLLKTSPEWRGTRLVIKTIVDSEDEKQKRAQQLNEFVSKENTECDIEVLVKKEGEQVVNIIHESSQGADLVFIGMRPPEDDESVDQYSQYYPQLLNYTEGLPTTVMVLASEQIDFDRIFEFRQPFRNQE